MIDTQELFFKVASAWLKLEDVHLALESGEELDGEIDNLIFSHLRNLDRAKENIKKELWRRGIVEKAYYDEESEF